MKDKILDISISHWNNHFAGISASTLSDMTNIPHGEVMILVENLSADGNGRLNENVTLYNASIEPSTGKIKHEPINTHIFFPSINSLQKHYQEHLIEFHEKGRYTNQLHKGGNQLDLIFFDIKVLNKYSLNKEKYDLDDDVVGGLLTLSTNFKTSTSEEELDEVYFNKIWYGKRKLDNDHISVGAILHDLSELPVKEQSYWHSFELKNPLFEIEDEDFEKFIDSAYCGRATSSEDPIQEIKRTLIEINNIFNFNIFRNTENPYLEYPLNNTFKQFVDCNSELYKLIGPDNLKLDSLKLYFTQYYKGEISKLLHQDSQRSFSSLQVLEVVISHLNKELTVRFKKEWNIVKDNRTEGDHKITKPFQSNINYITSFRSICKKVDMILKELATELKKHYHSCRKS